MTGTEILIFGAVAAVSGALFGWFVMGSDIED